MAGDSANPDPKLAFAGWPRLTRFYGISPLEIAEMPRMLLDVYADSLPVLQAEEHLLLIEACDMPHGDKKSRDGVFRRLRRAFRSAGIDTGEDEAPKVDLMTEGGRAAAAMLGIKVTGIESVRNPSEDETADA